MEDKIIYKIVTKSEWSIAEKEGNFKGSVVDKKDGFIHTSTSKQAKKSAELYFKDIDDLLLVAINCEKINDLVKWEPAKSRNNELFPHIYGDLPLSGVISVISLPLGTNGHIFPDNFSK